MGIFRHGLSGRGRGMGSRATRSVVVVFVALALAALAVFAAGALPGTKYAQAQETAKGTVTNEDVREFRRWYDEWKASPDPAAKAQKGRVFGRYLKKAVPRLSPHVLARASLVFTAGEVWHHNAVVIRDAVHQEWRGTHGVKADFRPARGAVMAWSRQSDGSVGTVTALTRFEWTVSADGTYEMEFEGVEAVRKWQVLGSQCYVNGSWQRMYDYHGAWTVLGATGMFGGYGTGDERSTEGVGRCMATPTEDPPYNPRFVEPAPKMGWTVDTMISNKQRYGDVYRPYLQHSPAPSVYEERYVLPDGPDPDGLPDELPLQRGAHVLLTPDIYEVDIAAPTELQPAPDDFVLNPDEFETLIRELEKDPDYKPWLRDDFRAPTDPLQREALWGPVISTWTTPDGSECKEFQSGAQVCDSPTGTTFAWIVKDGVAWMQYADGGKQWTAQPGPQSPRAPPGPGDGSGSTTLYRVIDQAELQDVQQLGDYHLSPHGGGKYFAVTEEGARRFANSYFNRSKELTLTSVEVPNSFLGNNGYYFDDIGQGGAGLSYQFSDKQLAEMYTVMGPVKILGRAN